MEPLYPGSMTPSYSKTLLKKKETAPVPPTVTNTTPPVSTPPANTVAQTTVNAKDLMAPAVMPNPPVLQQGAIPQSTQGMVGNVLGNIRATSESARALKEQYDTLSNFAGDSSGFDIQNEQLTRFGVTPERLRELEDIQLQLSDRKTESNITKSRILGAGGQTLSQGQREITQEDRESAIRDAGLASRAAVLQGNLETGRALAKDAVDIAMQDRTFKANTILKQIEYYQGIVDEETAQLLEAEKRKYEEDREKVKEVKESIVEAMVNGASQQEIARLNDANVSDDEKLALAQSITARGMNQMRDMEMKNAGLDMEIKKAQLNKLTAPEKSGIDWNQRANILKMATDGDPLAIQALGYDPRNSGLAPEKVMEFERNQAEARGTISMIDKMLDNSRGIGAITGQVKSPTLSGFFMGGKSDNSALSLISKIPVIGNIQGAIQSRNDRDQILTDLQNLYNTEGFQEFIGLKQSGLTFGALTEGERGAIFSAANRLNSALNVGMNAQGLPTGKVADYQGTAEDLRKDLAEVQEGLRAREEELAMRLTLSPDEMTQIINL